jgi:hypothetical protein
MRLLFFRSVVTFCLLSFGLSVICDAQYLERRKKYGQQEYIYQMGDPHPPFAAALGAVVLPGFGHLIAGEPKRALGFAGGFYGSAAIGFVGLVNLLNEDFYPEYPSGTQLKLYRTLYLAGITSTVVFYIYGIFDAMEVAEINNLSYRDRQKGLSWQFSPDLNSLTAQPQLNLCVKYTFGN